MRNRSIIPGMLKKLALMGVLTVPGPIAFTRMPWGASDTAIPFVSMLIPPLDAA